MTTFWIISGLMALIVTALLVLALIRGRRDIGPAVAFDVPVYRDQLKEVERDLARGVIGAEDAERARTEISRRILAADTAARKQTQAKKSGTGAARAIAAATALVVIGGAFAIYTQLGAPGYGDLSLSDRIAQAEEARKTRPSQAEAESQIPLSPPAEAAPEYIELVERLREAVQTRPDDLQGHVLLARSETALGNYTAAYEAYRRIVEIKGADATADDFADLAGTMIVAAGGYVSPEAEVQLNAAMERDRTNGAARYYGGLMMAQVGRPDVAFTIWQQLLREGPADAPWLPPIRQQIEELAFRAGVNDFELPPVANAPALAGPSQEDMAAAAEMTEEERQDMIRGMVDQLSDRLATEGGSPQEWARLIGALGVLGDADRARAIWAEAQTVFANAPDALAQVRRAAQQAGVAE